MIFAHDGASVSAARASAECWATACTKMTRSGCERVVALYDVMSERAREAIDIMGRRRGVAKDVRAMIGKMAWEEVWRWGEKGNAEVLW
jgi:hypothetical protein